MANDTSGIMALPAMDQQQGPGPAAQGPDAQMVFDSLRQNVSPREVSDELLATAAEADPQAVAEFKAALEELDVPDEILELLDRLVDEILADPGNYEAIKEKYRAQGVTEDILPEEFDPELFGALNLAIDQLRGKPAAPMAPQEFAKGGIANLTPVAKAIAAQGRNGDTMLAHITPAEARMLKKRGGSGTINPRTGLPEFANIFSRIGNAIKKFAGSTVGKLVIGTALFMVAGPAAAQFLTLSSPMAIAGVSGFVAGAGTTLLAGGNLRDALKAGAIGGITAGAMQGITGMGPGTPGAPSGAEAAPGAPGAPSAPAAPSAPTAPTAPTAPPAAISSGPTLPTLPGSQGLSSVMQPPTGIPTGTFTETGFAGMMPGSAPVAPPVSTAGVPAAAAPAGTSSVAAPTSLFDKTTDFLKQTFSPSAIEAQGIPAAEKAGREAITSLTNRLPDATPAMKEAAYQAAYKNALPGAFAKYGPAAAAGLGILGLSGGFQTKQVKSPYSDLFTGGPGSARDLMAKNPSLYYLQGLPGVSYYNGSVVPPTLAPTVSPPGYAHGGVVQHFEDGGAATNPVDPAASTPPIVGAAPAVTPPASQIGTPSVSSVEVATPASGGYNNYYPAAQNIFYGEMNKRLLSGIPTIDPSITSATPEQKADYYNQLIGQGYTDPQIRAGAGPQTNENWNQLRDIASRRPAVTGGGIGAFQPQPLMFPGQEELARLDAEYRKTMGDRAPRTEPPGYGAPLRLPGVTIPGAGAGGGGGGAPTLPPATNLSPEAKRLQGIFDTSIFNKTPNEKAAYYNSLLAQGYDDATIRAAINAPLDQNWLDLRSIAAGLRAGSTGGGGGGGGDTTTTTGGGGGGGGGGTTTTTGGGTTTTTGGGTTITPLERLRATFDMSILSGTPQQKAAYYNSLISAGYDDATIRAAIGAPEDDNWMLLRQLAAGQLSGGNLSPGGGAAKDTNDSTIVQQKALGGIAALGSGGYPRRTGQISGPGTEKSDSIPAMLSDGEFVMTARAVRGAGGGDRRKGAKKMYALMHQLERNASRG
jgi:hypothetical protein